MYTATLMMVVTIVLEVSLVLHFIFNFDEMDFTSETDTHTLITSNRADGATCKFVALLERLLFGHNFQINFPCYTLINLQLVARDADSKRYKANNVLKL